MTEYDTTIRTDERGVWCDAGPGRTYGIQWTEIYRVSGGKIDLIDSECITIELDFTFGEFIELNSESPGFRQAIDAISHHLPGIGGDWYTRIERLDKREPGIVVWQKAGDTHDGSKLPPN